MCFSLCYSIKKYLPEARFQIKFTERNTEISYFKWLRSLQQKKLTTFNLIITEPNITMIRPMEENNACTDVKEDKFTPFVSYVNGCGNFVMGDWINTDRYPFPYADNFMDKNLCVNEIKLLKLWKQMSSVYSLLTR